MFCTEFNSEHQFHYNDITVTLVINISHGNVATESILQGIVVARYVFKLLAKCG